MACVAAGPAGFRPRRAAGSPPRRGRACRGRRRAYWGGEGALGARPGWGELAARGALRRQRRDRLRCARGSAQSSSVNSFSLIYEGFDPAEEGLREALTSTGNGYLCTRGTAEWEDADGVHYPGTYGHGVYNRETTILGGVPGAQRGSREPAQLAGAQAAHRGRGRDPARRRRAARLPPRARHPYRDGDPRAAVPRPCRPGDRAAQPPVREHGRRPSRGHRVDAHPAELVGPGGGRIRRSTGASPTAASRVTSSSRAATSIRCHPGRSGPR